VNGNRPTRIPLSGVIAWDNDAEGLDERDSLCGI